ncbi:MAG: mannose-1-phosphate guanylyltransferase [Deltaproteobacteria bacterium]|nr:mannose-1-phosphate guanylyltransferase [Deltaproteobacteria bacterium]
MSRRSRPKQLLRFGSQQSLLSATVDRVLPLTGATRTLVVTSAEVAEAVRAELPQLPAENILVEPAGRDTAACVGWMAWRIAATHAGAVMLVVPSDHVIPDAIALRLALAAAAATAHARGGLVTLGLKPTRPETGYGYLELQDCVGTAGGLPVHRVLRFVEKPALSEAEDMLAAGNFRWNGGMFAWKIGEIRAAIRQHLPELAEGLDALMLAVAEVGEVEAMARCYGSLPKISIDFGVMEKAELVWSVAVDFAWSDVGSWLGLEEILEGSGEGLEIGDVLALESDGAVLVSDGPLVATIGVSDLVVVATRDAVLVVRKGDAQRVKEVVERLLSAARDDLL